MRFDRPISYNGWTASLTRPAGGGPASGYLFDSVQPSKVDAVGYLDKRAIQDGLDANDIYLGGREFAAIVFAYGSTWGDFWDKTQDLLAAFSPTLALAADTANAGFLAFDFIQPTADIATWPTSTYPYGIPMRYYLRPSSPPLFVLKRDEVGGDETQGLAHRFDLNLLARDPRKYLQSETSYTITTSTQTGTYRGDYPSKPIVTFSVTATGHSAFTLTVNGVANVLNLSSVSSGSFTLDYSKKTLIDGTGASRASLFSSIGGWPDAGTAAPTFRMTNSTGISAPIFKYREAWA
jgi:hypothetical protein